MAIEIIPKEITKPSRWQITLLYFSIFLLLVAILGYFALNYYFIKKADQEFQRLNDELTKARTPERVAIEKEVLDYQEKIEDFSSLILGYKKSSNFFDFIESITHPKVSFSELNLNPTTNQAGLSGRTDSFQALGEQLLIFQNAELIRSLTLSGIGVREEGKIDFNFNLSLDPILFNQ